MSKGTRKDAEELHGEVARLLLARLRSEDATASDIRNAMDWLHRHGITKFVEGSTEETMESALEKTGPDLPPLTLYDGEEEVA